ncbi:Hsp20/alpha crystallin family protein [Deinococcus psychrotolerans]|uniref:Hsp20/alpha crystallin family protein n=1 Tax=Deinococcus psychrotolerans TaxID=2489213 RepID=A0A3G8YCW5_9DEIO|nr:Hsp20/alpha crystallin family protein [Deinococcus psychrotolerans]AZI42770.1 Hsp20/alpha crystallin family protein [Deinococcus psychrotolerans]
MMRFDPFREIEELSQRVDRAFGQAAQAPARFAPPVDVHEDEQGLELSLDLPGIQPENISVDAENQTLSVQAERKYIRAEGRTAHRVERVYGTYSRTFSVPAKYDLSKVDANFDNGTLTIKVPRSEAAQKRSISVKSATTLNVEGKTDTENHNA